MEATVTSLEEELAAAHKETDEVVQKCDGMTSELAGRSDEINNLNLELATLHVEVAGLVQCHYSVVLFSPDCSVGRFETKQENREASLNKQMTENKVFANKLANSLLQMEEEERALCLTKGKACTEKLHKLSIKLEMKLSDASTEVHNLLGQISAIELLFFSSQCDMGFFLEHPFGLRVRNVGLMVKEVNHNATERNRRRKINSLYSSLRSLLPQPDQAKKLSIPATISGVLKYIPELQAQIQQLTREKERLLSCACDDLQCVGDDPEEHRGDPREIAGPKVVSTSWLCENEALVQICEGSCSVSGLSRVLLEMEINGLSLMNASSFKSTGGKMFHDLRVLTVEGFPRSQQVEQGGVFHQECSASLSSEFSWPMVTKLQSNAGSI
ncbi:hypothetical protein MLD38_007610 [Melastoma candidum]|uniref:Uncharacterized protein n=1 Tax=Melastoma candidum TaxID=119954 RepID=A0ACB9RS82_9MYRT|nr:hypothetical protein MLD38_007610 [Melastoma candidum]